MVQTRKSLGNFTNDKNVPQLRRSLESSTVKKIYPDLTETTSYSTTIHTSEKQDDDDVYETDNDTSFASSQGSETSFIEFSDTWKYVMITLIVLLAIIVGFSMTGKQTKVDTSSYENYIKSVRTILSTQFPSVTKENRDLLRHIGRRLFLEPENQAPLVILVGGKTSQEFSEAVNHVVQEVKNEGARENKSIRIESGTNRAELHENLREILGPSLASQVSPRTAVVLGVDLLKWDAVLVLHAFADHEKYPVPKTVLFLTVSQPDVSSEITTKTCDEEMTRFLTTRWIENGGTSDNIPPIIARISYFLCV